MASSTIHTSVHSNWSATSAGLSAAETIVRDHDTAIVFISGDSGLADDPGIAARRHVQPRDMSDPRAQPVTVGLFVMQMPEGLIQRDQPDLAAQLGGQMQAGLAHADDRDGQG